MLHYHINPCDKYIVEEITVSNINPMLSLPCMLQNVYLAFILDFIWSYRIKKKKSLVYVKSSCSFQSF